MAIVLHSKKNFHGTSITANSDLANLKQSDLKGSPGSIELTADDDRVLLFKQKDFGGACIFRHGKVGISDLGDKDAGGKLGFGNSITSVRFEPFSVLIHAVFIKNAKGKLPGTLTSNDDAGAFAVEVCKNTSDLWGPFLLTMKLDSVSFQTDDSHFDVVVGRLVRFPFEYYAKDRVNVFFINSFLLPLGGVTRPPCLGESIVLASIIGGGVLQPEGFGLTLAHEFGHHVGIHHPSAKNNPQNIMNSPETGPADHITQLTDEQVSDAHTALARNPARRGQRQG